MNNTNHFSIIKQSKLLKEFTAEELKILMSCSKEEFYRKGQYIAVEGRLHAEMFILLEGTVSVCARENNKEIVINELKKADSFGEISFFSDQPRTASIRANNDVDVFAIKYDLLKEHPNVYRKLELSSYKLNYGIISQSNKMIAKSIRKKMDFARIFTSAILVLMISNLFLRLLFTNLQGVNVYSEIFSWIYLLIIAVPCILIVKFNKEDLRDFGLTLVNWKLAIFEGALLSLIVIIIFAMIIMYQAYHYQQPWISFINTSRLDFFQFFNYMMHASFQEFLRSIFYISLIELYAGKKLLATFFGALVFATLHIQFGYIAVLITFIAGILFNSLQNRHKTLIGIILFHSIAGWAAFTVKFI